MLAVIKSRQDLKVIWSQEDRSGSMAIINLIGSEDFDMNLVIVIQIQSRNSCSFIKFAIAVLVLKILPN